MTKEWTPLEPDVVENKYYAPGVGEVLAIMVEGGSERWELVDMSTLRLGELRLTSSCAHLNFL
jgi:hypothetical protein